MAKADGFSELRFDRISSADSVARSEDFLQQMRKRRTIRMFSSEPVPMEVIENAILTAGTAPSGANQQPWRFVVITEPDLKHQLREAAEAEERESYEHRMSDEWLTALTPLGTTWEKPHLTDAPAIIVAFKLEFGLSIAEDGTECRTKHYYPTESMGIAVGFLIAALHNAGLATLTHTPSPMAFLNELLDRPRNERPFVVLPVGYPADDCVVPQLSKKTLGEIAEFR